LLIAFLPTRLRNPGNLTLKRQTAEAQAAEAELAQESARPSADAAAVAVLGGELGLLVRLGDLRSCCHFFLCSQQSALGNQHSAKTRTSSFGLNCFFPVAIASLSINPLYDQNIPWFLVYS
jgi:hypothetical protein